MAKTIDLVGQRFGRWLVSSKSEKHGKHVYWNCLCDCGNTAAVYAGSLTRGKSISCGCFNKEGTIARCLSHGHANGGNGTKTYNCWRNMKARCSNPNNHKWADYGGRGIRYTPAWETFDGFLADMGECPSSKHSIDRIDVNNNYEPSNCRWATPIEQGNNQRTNTLLTHNGRTMTLADWSRETGINRTTILQRINRSKWSVERALTERVHFVRHS